MPGQALLLANGSTTPLAAALQKLRWVVHNRTPGVSLPALLADGLRTVDVVVILGAPDALDAEAKAAIIARRAEVEHDPAGRLLLVVTKNGVPPKTEHLLGLTTLVPLPEQPADALARAIHEAARARGLGPNPAPKVRVAVVAESDELGAVRAEVAAELAKLVRVAEAPHGPPDHPPHADLTVVLVGIRTDAAQTEAIRQLRTGAHVVTMRLGQPDINRADFARHLPGMTLWQELGTTGGVLPFTDDALRVARDAVSDWIRENRPVAEGVDPSLQPWEDRYLRGNLKLWATGGHRGIDHLAKDERLSRDALYVPLTAALTDVWQDERGVHLPTPEKARRSKHAIKLEEFTARQPIFLERAACLAEAPCVAFIGEAGTGKTVLLQRLATTLTRLHLREPADDALLNLDALRRDDLLRVPILLEASAIATAACAPDAGPERAVACAIEARFKSRDLPPDAVTHGLGSGRYLLLIDALDEVADAAHRANVLTALTHVAAAGACRIVLSTRPTRHTGAELPEGFLRVGIARLDEVQRTAMVERWSEARYYAEAEQADLGRALVGLGARLGAGDDSPLSNPLFVTALMYVWHLMHRLPRNTADLYHQVVDAMCAPRGTAQGAGRDEVVPARLRAWLKVVCLTAQEAGGTVLPLEKAWLALTRANVGLPNESDAIEALDQVIRHTGLLRYEDQVVAGRTVRCVRPWHRTFQEFLAASAIVSADRDAAAIADDLIDHAGRLLAPEWRGCLGFLVGAWLLRGEPEARRGLDRWLERAATEQTKLQGRMYALAAEWLDEYRDPWFSEDPRRTSLPVALCEHYREHGADWHWQDRVAALGAIGRLGPDPRLPDPRTSTARWVFLPRGRHKLGGDRKAIQASPRQEAELGPIWLLNSHVTVADARPFIEDPDHERYWAGLPEDERHLPDGWHDQREHGNVPLWGVSWWWSIAFSRWATASWELPPNMVVTLPTSAHWEAAVQHHARPFPWPGDDGGQGDEAFAAHDWGGDPLGGAVAVGCFPRGGVRGLHDPVGNLWCWTASPYGDEKEGERVDLATILVATPTPIDRSSTSRPDLWGAPRGLRGGSANLHPWYLRCAGRDGYPPSYRDRYVGFRVCARLLRMR